MLKKAWSYIISCILLTLLIGTWLPTAVSAAAWDGIGSNTNWNGSGTPSDPYIIHSAAQLKGLADSVNNGAPYSGIYFKMDDDIDLSNHPWTPIGGACEIVSGIPAGNFFAGTFDGNNHTISGINISNPAADTGAYGFFGYINGGILANLSVAGYLDMGTNSVNQIGSVVGYTNGSLLNVHSSMTVYMNDNENLSSSQCGGIAGVIQNTGSGLPLCIRYCSNSGDVTGRGRIGGIVGAVYCTSSGGVIIDQCYNTGNITSTFSMTKIFSGGIVGYCMGYISNCYNQGNMTTNSGHYLAGIVGILNGINGIYASLSNCYSTAVFSNYNPGYDRWLWASADGNPAVHITNCFWLPDAGNSNITQPDDVNNSWGTQVDVSSITEDELQGAAEMTENNLSGAFSGYVVNHYLGEADPDNTEGSYGFGYIHAGSYPILWWQTFSNFKIDLSSGAPSPIVRFSIAASMNGGHGTTTVNPVLVNYGGSSTISLHPETGYWLDMITDNGRDVLTLVSNNRYVISNITENHTVIVTLTDGTHTLTYCAGAHGSVTGVSPQSVIEGGSGSAVTVAADSGYHFVGWNDNSTANPRIDINVTEDMAVKAIFIKDSTGFAPTDHFTIAVLPDTQNYSESYPQIFDQQTQWIADHSEDQNIVFVSHLGDLVNVYNSAAQWQNARNSMSIIRLAGIPYSVVPGNHDLNNAVGDLTHFDTNFPYSGFSGYDWYGGHYPETSNVSNFELFSAMGQDFIILNLVCTPVLQAGVTDWANTVLTQHSDRKAIIITHGYIDTEGNYLDIPSVSGLNLWNAVVQDNSNIIAVLCGHYAGEYNNTATGTSGNTIYNLLTDYQDLANGGNGWLRLYEFYPAQNVITAVTYSPYLDEYDSGKYAQFDLFLQMTAPVWDLNADNVCNIGDVVKIGLVWGQTGAPGWIPEDANNDGLINIGDVVFIGLHWGETW